MDHLSKQQIVLLALLVSFMTSLATGIVTVSLMDQAPQGITRTISQVIEKTIEQAAPQGAAAGTVTLSVDDQLAAAVAKASASVVRIEDSRSGSVVGLGLVVSANGMIMTDRSLIVPGASYTALFSDGAAVPLNLIQNQQGQAGDLSYLMPAPLAGSVPAYAPIASVPAYALGQAVYSLAGTSTSILGQGVITAAGAASSSPIATSIPADKTALGGPLFDIRGNVIGVRTSSLSASDGASFDPLAPLLTGSSVSN